MSPGDATALAHLLARCRRWDGGRESATTAALRRLLAAGERTSEAEGRLVTLGTMLRKNATHADMLAILGER